jgi:hypothetical protein
VNKWRFENSAEERMKQQVETSRLNRPYSGRSNKKNETTKRDGLKLGRRKKGIEGKKGTKKQTKEESNKSTCSTVCDAEAWATHVRGIRANLACADNAL